MKHLKSALLSLTLGATLLIPCGCEVDSADTFSRDVTTDFSGFYTPCDGNNSIVLQNSGNRIRTLDLRQSGDTLEAVDNNGALWRGTLGEVQNGRSSFELRGRTTTGIEGIFSGTLSSSDGGTTNRASSAEGSMTGTFIEPDRFSTFCARADIPGTIDDGSGGGGGGSFRIEANPPTVGPNGTSQLSIVGNCNQTNVTWSITQGPGSLSSSTGCSVTYSRGGASGAQATIRAVNTASSQTAVFNLIFSN